MNKQREQTIYNYGYLLLEEIYNKLGISSVIKSTDDKHKNTFDLDQILRLLVYSRILFPGSKSKAIVTQGKFVGEWNHEYNHVIRSLDLLSKLKNEIQYKMHTQINQDIGREATLVFYDVTNYYFEVDFADNDELDENGKIIHQALRRLGFSKENKKAPIVQLGLFMDNNGIPISYELFPGNCSDPKTYIPAIEQVKEQFGIERIVTVADKAMNSARNVTDAVNKGDGWLFSQKIRGKRGVATELQTFALDPSGWFFDEDRTFGMKSMIRKRKLSTGKTVNEKVLVTYNEKYATREKRRRNGALEYAEKLTNAELYRITSKKGGKRYLQQLVEDPITGDQIELSPFIGIDRDLVEYDELFDGLNVIVTSETQMNDEEMIYQYRQLTHIEECFRKTKTELKTRPVYLRIDEHIEAHFLTCFISLTILKLLEYKLGRKMSSAQIVDALRDSNATKLEQGMYILNRTGTVELLDKYLNIKKENQYIKSENLIKYYRDSI